MTVRSYAHWTDVPAEDWPWPHFSPEEVACRGTGRLVVNPAAMDALERLRHALGAPMILRSAYRSPEHNRAVGGAPRSKHMEATAFDVAMANHDPRRFEALARDCGFQGFGFYPRSGFMHVDLGPAREWGERFPTRATRFETEPPIARERLAESRTMKGGGLAGAATVGGAGVEVAQEALAEASGRVAGLVPYLDTMRWAFIALALVGIGIAVYARYDDWRRAKR